jgi:hypothetical protein
VFSGQSMHSRAATAEYVPASQVLQELAAAAAEYLPAAHAAHEDEPASENVPLTQVSHPDAPTTDENLPDSHGRQDGPAVPALQPSMQSPEEVLPGAELKPSGQMMHVSADVAAATLEYVPPGQLMHTPDPGSLLYLPATQLTQGPPSKPSYPLLHRQSLAATLPTDEVDPAGHAMHCTVTENVPAICVACE